MPTCIFSGVEFSSAQREHILQSFLGASWVSRTIACDEVQQIFGRTIDAGLEATLRPIRVLLGTRGDRGGRNSRGEGLKGLVSTAGEIFDVEPGGRPRLAVPIVKAKRTESGHRVAITVSSEDQLDWAAHEASKLLSGYQLTSQEILDRGRRAPAFSQGEIPVPLAVHPLYHRGALKAAFNLLGACNASVALSGSCDEVRQFILSATGEPSDFIRRSRAPGRPPHPTIGPVDHVIALYGREPVIDGYILFFGSIAHAIRLSASYAGPPFDCSYVVDPTRQGLRQMKQALFDAAEMPKFEEQSRAADHDVRLVIADRLRGVAAIWNWNNRSNFAHPPSIIIEPARIVGPQRDYVDMDSVRAAVVEELMKDGDR